VKCGGFVDKALLNPQLRIGIERLNPRGKPPHVTEVIKELAIDQCIALYSRF
jgi:hypothetical protein